MGDGFREIDLTDEEQGFIKLLVPTPAGDDPWGVLAPLRGTAWGDQIPEVSAEAVSHALHGWATPLTRVIGVKPYVHAKRIPADVGLCRLHRSCLGATADCRPGVEVPGCYEGPDLDAAVARVAARVAMAWGEGRFVVVPVGEGFNVF